MGAGFAVTGTMLVLALVAAAVLRWSSRRGHAVALAMSAVVATAALFALGAGGWRESLLADARPAPSAALTAPAAPEPASTLPGSPAPATTEVHWLTAEGDQVRAAIPWPEDLGDAVVLEGVPTPVGVDAETLADFYAELGLLAHDGTAFVVQTRAGWTARVQLDGGYVTVAFD